ncbi:MAG: flagellar motor protein [Pseudomonadota bacterium]
MRLDFLSFIGILVAFLAVVGGNWLEGGHIDSLINGPAMVIVIGGTVGAILLQTPVNVFIHALRLSGRVFMPGHMDMGATLTKLVEWSNIARKEGLLGLETIAENQKDPFIRKGMQMLVDGNEPDILRDAMEMEVDASEQYDLQAARVFEGMGGYSPTIGIIGAVMGLIHVMQNLADPSKLGSGIATAFVATIYGVGLANLFLLPFATKLKTQTQTITKYRELVIEGVVGIAEGDNPRNIEAKLQGFLQ